MSGLRFNWDQRKSRTNQTKHGISFEEARTAFYDENARVAQDPDHSGHEDRFVLLGLSTALRVLVVRRCYRESDEVIRIISVRKATRKEQDEFRRWLR
jgi:uncharacterized DUF497 family protein